MTGTDIIALLLATILAYIYLGYPILLWLACRIFPRRSKGGFDLRHEPTVTLVISAYNEEDVIAAKIENSLALDYPAEKLTIMVVSDCSCDGTDGIVLSFAGRGVRLVRSEQRLGKTWALNRALELVTSEVVIFSDANAIYDRSAVRYLVGHFAEPEVGYVVGHARYHEQSRTPAGSSEGAYWNLEVMIKECESRLSSVVGGDGAIYAIRRALYEPMQVTDINDFVNPLQIVAKGYRGLFESRAWCVEYPAGEFAKEFSRKLRIANRSFNAVLRVPQALNPFRVGPFFAWQLVSHKILRWFSPFFLGALLVANAIALAMEPLRPVNLLCAFLWCALLTPALAGRLLRKRDLPSLFSLPYYFVLMNIASARGILLRLRGKTISTWTTVRDHPEAAAVERSSWQHLLYLAPVLVVVFCCVFAPGSALAAAAFFLLGAVAHAFFFYPLFLSVLGRAARKEIVRDEGYLPSVTLLIVAYNEERDIGQKIRNSLALDYPREKLDIVVASDGSTDATNSIVSRYAACGVTLMAFPVNRGKIAALNEAMSRISSEIVVLSDANVDYDSLAIRKLVRNFSDPRVGAVSGKVLLLNGTVSYGDSENGYYCVEHFIQEHEGMMGTLVGGDGAMYAIRRRLFEAPPPDTILDDMVICMAIACRGHLVLHEKQALGFEANHLELAGEFRRKVRIIAGGYQCLLRCAVLPRPSQPLLLFCFVSHKFLRWISGIIVLALLVVLSRIQFFTQAPHPLFSVTLLLLALSMLVAGLVQLFPLLKKFRLSNYSHYFYMLLLASLVGCYRGITGRQKVAWRGGTT